MEVRFGFVFGFALPVCGLSFVLSRLILFLGMSKFDSSCMSGHVAKNNFSRIDCIKYLVGPMCGEEQC